MCAKQRLTTLICANIEGKTEHPLVIRCFKGSHNKLPLEWYCNKKAWMTTDIKTRLKKIKEVMIK